VVMQHWMKSSTTSAFRRGVPTEKKKKHEWLLPVRVPAPACRVNLER
jgi:hypothetical protein